MFNRRAWLAGCFSWLRIMILGDKYWATTGVYVIDYTNC